MENRSHALTTGFFTITLLIAAILYGLWFNRDRVERVPYVIATAQAIPGLNPQAPMRYRGLEVGRVGSIAFDPKVAGQILVTLNINTDAPITTTTFAALGYQGVTGIAFIALDDDKTGSPLPSSAITGAHPAAPRPVRPDRKARQGNPGADRGSDAPPEYAAQPENQKVILGAFRCQRNGAEVPRAAGKLQPTIDKLPALADQTQKTLHSVTALATDVNKLTTACRPGRPDRPHHHHGGAHRRLGGCGGRRPGTGHAAAVNSLSDDTRASMRALRKTMNKINDRPQSLIFGAPGTPPGPGEEGFTAQSK
jgi:phospholipid/cholesterol/gamma-HCH transport system substrate-binding protein